MKYGIVYNVIFILLCHPAVGSSSGPDDDDDGADWNAAIKWNYEALRTMMATFSLT